MGKLRHGKPLTCSGSHRQVTPSGSRVWAPWAHEEGLSKKASKVFSHLWDSEVLVCSPQEPSSNHVLFVLFLWPLGHAPPKAKEARHCWLILSQLHRLGMEPGHSASSVAGAGGCGLAASQQLGCGFTGWPMRRAVGPWSPGSGTLLRAVSVGRGKVCNPECNEMDMWSWKALHGLCSVPRWSVADPRALQWSSLGLWSSKRGFKRISRSRILQKGVSLLRAKSRDKAGVAITVGNLLTDQGELMGCS